MIHCTMLKEILYVKGEAYGIFYTADLKNRIKK